MSYLFLLVFCMCECLCVDMCTKHEPGACLGQKLVAASITVVPDADELTLGWWGWNHSPLKEQ